MIKKKTMDKRGTQPRLLKEILKETVKQFGLESKLKENEIPLIWKNEVGEEVSKHTEPIKVRKGRLFVKVDNPIWLHKLKVIEKDITDKVNNKLQKKVIKDIYWSLR